MSDRVDTPALVIYDRAAAELDDAIYSADATAIENRFNAELLPRRLRSQNAGSPLAWGSYRSREHVMKDEAEVTPPRLSASILSILASQESKITPQ